MSPAAVRLRAAYARAEQYAAVGQTGVAERILREAGCKRPHDEILDLQAIAAERAGEFHAAARFQRAEGYR